MPTTTREVIAAITPKNKAYTRKAIKNCPKINGGTIKTDRAIDVRNTIPMIFLILLPLKIDYYNFSLGISYGQTSRGICPILE